MNDDLKRRIERVVDDHLVCVITGSEGAFVSLVGSILKTIPGDMNGKRWVVRHVLDEIDATLTDTTSGVDEVDKDGAWIVAELTLAKFTIYEAFDTYVDIPES